MTKVKNTGTKKVEPRANATETEKHLREQISRLEASLTQKDKAIDRLNAQIKTLEAANESWRRKFHDKRIDSRGQIV